jgi:hypothetical protein
MIKLPSKDEIEKLSEIRHANCVSIYCAYIEPSGPSDNPNRIQLKNLVKEARDMMSAEGLKMREIDAILGPADKLLETIEFRPKFKHSLALFMYDGFFRCYRLPTIMNKSAISIGDRFTTQFIQKILAENSNYYLLSLSHNGAKLMVGDRYELNDLQFKKPIKKLKSELNIDETPKSLQPHPIGPNSQGKKSEKFHEQYSQASYDKEMLSEYFRHVDHEIKGVTKEKYPLVLAGAQYLIPLFRQVCTYPNTCKEEIRGNIEHTPPEEIRKLAYKIVEP